MPSTKCPRLWTRCWGQQQAGDSSSSSGGDSSSEGSSGDSSSPTTPVAPSPRRQVCLHVESYDSSEAGRGKTLLDAHFAVLKRAMRAEVVRGAGEKDIVDPRSMFEAAARLDTRGPPCATTVALVKPINLGLPSDVKPITDMMSASKKNTIGIRRTASVAFERGAAAFSVSEMSGMPGAAMQPHICPHRHWRWCVCQHRWCF